jgi:hypothetical protein
MRMLEEDDDGDEAFDLAQEKAFEAMEAPLAEERIALAREALALSPLCSDAYLVLAQKPPMRRGARTPPASRRCRRRSVGRDRLPGRRRFVLGLLQTRPYMRARRALAMALWRLGHREEAVAHCHEMLRLNPNDNRASATC